MLTKAKTLIRYTLDGRDGKLGHVKEFYFDDEHWTVRYLVADTGDWLSGRQVLISPYALKAVNHEEELIALDLTKKQIEDSPALVNDQPVSRQFETAYYGFYEYPNYWGGPYAWGPFPHIEREPAKWKESIRDKKAWDPHLRSTHAVSGYHIQAQDGEIGHVEDFVIDDKTWAIRYLIINTHNWWPGNKVLVSPQWIKSVSWSDSKVFVTLSRRAIKEAPEYTVDSPITRDYETGLFRHYDRQGYWVDAPVVEVIPRKKMANKTT